MKLVELFDLFMIDLDGVVYVGDKPTPGARETIATLRALGKSLIFLTNDPRGSSHEYSEKLRKMDIVTNPEDIITSSMTVAYYIRENYKLDGRKAYVVGSEALKEEIRNIGLRLVEGEEAKRADFVVIGGHSQVHYQEIKIAALAVRNGAHFLGTNRDPVYPTEEGLVPGTGALLAAIEVASGKKAITAGKPEPVMFETGKKLLPSQGRIAVIGDSLFSDILGGKRAGITTILALTGSTKQSDLSKSEIIPNYVIGDLRDLLKEQAAI
ncbi:MAG TPA: HAD-IIA family hydrolase [Thermodesulfobacteriota bacterium]|nr:HAD-IIA family hydrolase [Thermodesulfobacteriota bacterium]